MKVLRFWTKVFEIYSYTTCVLKWSNHIVWESAYHGSNDFFKFRKFTSWGITVENWHDHVLLTSQENITSKSYLHIFLCLLYIDRCDFVSYVWHCIAANYLQSILKETFWCLWHKIHNIYILHWFLEGYANLFQFCFVFASILLHCHLDKLIAENLDII